MYQTQILRRVSDPNNYEYDECDAPNQLAQFFKSKFILF